MQITTTKESLASRLALVAGAADTRGCVPVLGTVLLKTTDTGALSMICSDTGTLAKALTPVEVKQAGEVAVDVRRISELVRALPDQQPIDISIETGKGTLLVKSGRSRFRLPTLAASEYPRMAPAKEERISITMSARRLADMIVDASPSMADSDVRTYLNGALFALDSAGLAIVSTDGHRMTVSHEPIAGAGTLTPRNVIVPRKTVLLAKKLLGQGGNVTLTLGTRNVQFTFEDGTVLFGNALDGQFPAWRSIIPATCHQITISTERLSSALAMLAAAPDDKATQEAMKSKVEVCCTATTTTLRRGEAGFCELDSTSSSDAPHESAFNIHYLIDAMDTLRSSSAEAVIGFSTDAPAVTICPKDKAYPLVVVMPLRT